MKDTPESYGIGAAGLDLAALLGVEQRLSIQLEQEREALSYALKGCADILRDCIEILHANGYPGHASLANAYRAAALEALGMERPIAELELVKGGDR
jgi:hypothetical protein